MVWLCEVSNSVWCACVRGQTVCGVVVEVSNSVWCGCVKGQTVCGVVV